MRPPIVHVQWVDSSYGVAGWQEIEDTKEWREKASSVCETAGFLVYESPDHIVIAVSVNELQYADMMKIPKGAIVHRSELVSGVL